MYRVGQKSKLLYFFISSLNIDQFSQFFLPVDCGKKLLLSGMHPIFIM